MACLPLVLSRDLKEHGEFLREGIADDKDELQVLKADLAACKNEAKGAEEKVKVELQKKIEELCDEIESLKEAIESQVAESKAFRESKREFTLEYINTLVHGKGARPNKF